MCAGGKCKFLRAEKSRVALGARLCLITLNQVADPLGFRLAMPMAGDRIAAARRFNHDFGPEHAGRDVNRRDFRNRYALFVASK